MITLNNKLSVEMDLMFEVNSLVFWEGAIIYTDNS